MLINSFIENLICAYQRIVCESEIDDDQQQKRENKNSGNRRRTQQHLFQQRHRHIASFFLHYTLACCIPFRFIYRKKLRLDSLKKNVRRKRNGKNSLAFGIFVLSVDFYVSVAVALPRFVLFAHFNRFVLCANSNSSAQFVRTLTHSLSLNSALT